jgi:hypothetical protein
MTTTEEITAKLEPDVAQFAQTFLPRMGTDTVLLFSIATSMKRIADALDHFKTYGIEGV